MAEEWQGVVRTIEPPRWVEVDVSAVLRPGPIGSTKNATLQVRAYGLYPGGWQRGLQLAWYQLSTGEWYGLVTIDLTSMNQRTNLSLTALWPAKALRLPTGDR
jgi:hypothetical protein